MKTLCFSPRLRSTSSSSSSSSAISLFSSPSRFGFSPSRPSFSDSVIDRTVEIVEPVIIKWDPHANVTSLFSADNKKEAKRFIKCVNNLNKVMNFVLTENSYVDKLDRAQFLMQIAMKRLQKEFYQILSLNRAYLNPESVSPLSSHTSTSSGDDDEDATVAMTDLRLIAECMISSGYAKECLKIYKIIRKSVIDEALYRLGVEKLSSSKMDWEVVELRIMDWLKAVNVAVKTIFNGERALCDHIFISDDSIRESCFCDISKDGATTLFSFPQSVARNSNKSPEKVFGYLDMYNCISNNWPEIESIFSSPIQAQAVASLIKLSDSIKTALSEFEMVLQKDSSKPLVAGGGIHSLTIDAMDYITLIADYSHLLSDILPETPPPAKPESYFGISDSTDSPKPSISVRFAWLILILLCKIDGKARHYKDVSLAYLFLANNLQYVVTKVRRSSNLNFLLGDSWLSRQEAKIKQFLSNYQQCGWGNVIASIPPEPAGVMAREEVKEIFKRFNLSFEEAYRKQYVYVVCDSRMRQELQVSIEAKIVPLYREFYNKHRLEMVRERHSAHVLRFAPQDLANRLSHLFFDSGEYSSSFGSTSSTSTSPQPINCVSDSGVLVSE